MFVLRGLFFFMVLFLPLGILQGAEVIYHLTIEEGIANKSGQKEVPSITINGQIPGPVLKFHEGDQAILHVTNRLKKPTTVHWHGLLVPPNMDGVPYVSMLPIEPGETFTYRFPIRQAGTYWYHSHWNLQEQRGQYGPIVIYPKKENLQYDREYVLLLSDWIDTKPKHVLHNLKKEGDYYALKQKSVGSWLKAIKEGVFKRRLKQAMLRKVPLGMSDVGYDTFLANGDPVHYLGPAKPGERVRLRIINGSTSSYYNLEFAGGPMEIVAADGQEVVPFKRQRQMIGVAETYDVIVTLPEDKTFEFRASAVDGTGHSSALLGEYDDIVYAPNIPPPNRMLLQERMLPLKKQAKFSEKKKQRLAQIPEVYDQYLKFEKNYGKLRSPHPTTLNPKNPIRDVKLVLTGRMDDYVWSFNGKTLSEDSLIPIRQGETVRFHFINKTMMNHPLHLHGHFFRVLNGQGDYSPLKHTINVAPGQKLTIEFDANEKKDWFFHCHILYHLGTGMARIVQYQETASENKLFAAGRKDHREIKDTDWYFLGNFALQSQMTSGIFRFSNLHYAVDFNWENDYTGQYDTELVFEGRVSKWFKLIFGGRFFFEDDLTINGGLFGFRYTLPFWINMQAYIDTTGHYRLTFDSDVQLTDRLQLNWEVNTDPEVYVQLEYRIFKWFSVMASYNSDFGPGGGVNFRF